MILEIILPQKLATVITLCLAVVVYCVALLLLGGLTEEEILSMPKGHAIVKFLKKVHLLREGYY